MRSLGEVGRGRERVLWCCVVLIPSHAMCVRQTAAVQMLCGGSDIVVSTFQLVTCRDAWHAEGNARST